MIRRYKSNTNTLVREKSTGDVYVAFMNSLYPAVREKIRLHIELHSITKDIMQIQRAVEMADTLIHEGLGMKGTFNNMGSATRAKRDRITRNRNGNNIRGKARNRGRLRTRTQTFQAVSNKTFTYNNNGYDTYRDRSRSRSRSRNDRGRGRGFNKFNRYLTKYVTYFIIHNAFNRFRWYLT